MSTFSDLQGKTILSITGCEKRSEEIVIVCTDLTQFVLSHRQDCCELVRVEDVTGDPQDLVGHRVVLADESTNQNEPPSNYAIGESFTWTFYRLRTHGGDLTIRWLGESNGYYSESVDVDTHKVSVADLPYASQVLLDSMLERGL